jgi:hypothetical protein
MKNLERSIAIGLILGVTACGSGSNEGESCKFTYTDAHSGKEITEQVPAELRVRVNHADGSVQSIQCDGEDGSFRSTVPGGADIQLDKNAEGEVTDIKR